MTKWVKMIVLKKTVEKNLVALKKTDRRGDHSVELRRSVAHHG